MFTKNNQDTEWKLSHQWCGVDSYEWVLLHDMHSDLRVFVCIVDITSHILCLNVIEHLVCVHILWLKHGTLIHREFLTYRKHRKQWAFHLFSFHSMYNGNKRCIFKDIMIKMCCIMNDNLLFKVLKKMSIFCGSVRPGEKVCGLQLWPLSLAPGQLRQINASGRMHACTATSRFLWMHINYNAWLLRHYPNAHLHNTHISLSLCPSIAHTPTNTHRLKEAGRSSTTNQINKSFKFIKPDIRMLSISMVIDFSSTKHRWRAYSCSFLYIIRQSIPNSYSSYRTSPKEPYMWMSSHPQV